MTEFNSSTVKIRPAATLVLLRDGEHGIEVLALKRASTMRFLPNHVAFPGGSLEASDMEHNGVLVGAVDGRRHEDDAVYAYGALRECAEEVGWLCGLNGTPSVVLLDEAEQSSILCEGRTFADVIAKRHQKLQGSALTLVGRWVTPDFMPARFDTRFFAMVLEGTVPPVRMVSQENEWIRWCSPSQLLEQIHSGEMEAVPPTIAMLKWIVAARTASDVPKTLYSTGPSEVAVAQMRKQRESSRTK